MREKKAVFPPSHNTESYVLHVHFISEAHLHYQALKSFVLGIYNAIGNQVSSPPMQVGGTLKK